MVNFTLKVLDKDGNTKCADSGEGAASLVVRGEYEEGDKLLLETSEKNIHVWLQPDDALGASFMYITDDVEYRIPFERTEDQSVSQGLFRLHPLHVGAPCQGG